MVQSVTKATGDHFNFNCKEGDFRDQTKERVRKVIDDSKPALTFSLITTAHIALSAVSGVCKVAIQTLILITWSEKKEVLDPVVDEGVNILKEKVQKKIDPKIEKSVEKSSEVSKKASDTSLDYSFSVLNKLNWLVKIF